MGIVMMRFLIEFRRLQCVEKQCDYLNLIHVSNDSLGQVENARRHLHFKEYQPDPNEAQKLQLVEKHLNACMNSRRVRDWGCVLREAGGAISCGADACPQVTRLSFYEIVDSIINDCDGTEFVYVTNF